MRDRELHSKHFYSLLVRPRLANKTVYAAKVNIIDHLFSKEYLMYGVISSNAHFSCVLNRKLNLKHSNDMVTN